MGLPPGKTLHSRYNPVKEAERFAESLDFPSNASVIAVCEPGDSYLAAPLRSRFPSARLIALRLQRELFHESDGLWNAVWRPGQGESLRSFLLRQVPDEELSLFGFAEWRPGSEAWREEAKRVQDALGAFLALQRRIIATRSAFGPRWMKNMVRGALGVRNPVQTKKIDKPILLAGAGPTLDSALLRGFGDMHTLTVSSALCAFRRKGVVPNVCVATDGGYWALRYFSDLDASTILAVPLEAAVPPDILERNPVMVLDYGSALESAFLESCGLSGTPAKRNGTVSGTALELALSMTEGRVFGSGLDFMSREGYSHVRGHPAELSLRNGSNRFSPLASRFGGIPRTDDALETYAGWFEDSAPRLKNRFARLSPCGRPLSGIDCVDPARVLSSSEGSAGSWSCLENKGDIVPLKERQRRLEGLITDALAFFSDLADPQTLSFKTENLLMLSRPGLLSETMQYLRYPQYLEILPLIPRVTAEPDCARRIAAAAEKTADSLRDLNRRLRRYERFLA